MTDAAYKAHTLRMLQFLLIKAHDPKWNPGESQALAMTALAEAMAQSFDTLAETAPILDAVLRLFERDPHQYSSRPCETCRTISGLVGRQFGCERKAAKP